MDGKPWIGRVLAQISPTATTGGILRLKLSDYPPLLQDFGSVRMGTSSLSNDRPTGLFYPTIITRAAGNVFHALNAECTHAGCTVPIYNASAQYSQCPCHGSRFRIDGTVLRGPASFPMTSYQTTFDGADDLSVAIPEMSFELTSTGVDTVAGSRLRLEFIAFSNINYEVWFQETLDQSPAVVPFSTTPDGPLDRRVQPGIDDFAVVYVDRETPTGFYSVASRTMPV